MDLTGLGSVADFAKDMVDRFIPPQATEVEKAAIQIKIQELIDKREANLLETQKSVMISEMQQEDPFTKRARPMVVYSGLLFIFLVHVLIPLISFIFAKPMPGLSLPTDFWYAWTGVVGVWMVGSTVEKMGPGSTVVKAITGSK